jgi:hypothetical protein
MQSIVGKDQGIKDATNSIDNMAASISLAIVEMGKLIGKFTDPAINSLNQAKERARTGNQSNPLFDFLYGKAPTTYDPMSQVNPGLTPGFVKLAQDRIKQDKEAAKRQKELAAMLLKQTKTLKEQTTKKMTLTEDVAISKNLKYHLDNGLNLSEQVFRIYSPSYFAMINEVRNLWENNFIELSEEDKWIVESDMGKVALLEDGRQVFLDVPFEDEFDILKEAEYRGKKVNLNSPFRTPGGPKKFAVYVKSDSGNVKKVTFGDPNLRIKNANKARAKSFRARHKCDQKKDKTKAGYWSCNVARYRKKLGLKSSRTW